MTPRNNVPMMLAGLALVLLGAGLLLALAGRDRMITGIAWGICVAYAGTMLYSILVPRPSDKGSFSFLQGYLPGALIRYSVMISVFCAVVFWLRVSSAGVLIGTFAGMRVSTFVSLNRMRLATAQPPEA
jgi:hypothetical protein